ncbi:MAG TPA: prepilin-type N-terminal cleavage/methylation domain-containing protein [Gemmatimonadaceae bacterium]|nr:prepilin-type N-terminal cleavage/methylation domain-containing protein [Gemmatimonadaceae bacterium]
MAYRRRRDGFTLPEVILVIVILVIVAAVAFPWVRDRFVGAHHPAGIQIVAPPPARAFPGDTVPVSVRVVDDADRPVERVTVRFVPCDSASHALPDSAITDSVGVALTRWVLAPRAGPQRLEAHVQAKASVVARVEIAVAARDSVPALADSTQHQDSTGDAPRAQPGARPDSAAPPHVGTVTTALFVDTPSGHG